MEIPMRKTDEEIKEKMDKRLSDYNRLLDFCRDQPRCKLEINDEFQAELGMSALQSMITTLLKRQMLTAKASATHGKRNEYQTAPGAVYFHLPYHNRKKSTGRPATTNEKYVVEGNKTIVSSNGYHTKGSSGKQSVWIGSSIGAIE